MSAIRIEDDPRIEGVITVLLIGAVISAAIAAGIEAAALAALLSAQKRYRPQVRRYTELRCQDGAWRIVRIDKSVARIETPTVRLSHRGLVVLGIVDAGRRACLVFSSSAPRDDLRRLRVLLRTGARSIVSS